VNQLKIVLLSSFVILLISLVVPTSILFSIHRKTALEVTRIARQTGIEDQVFCSKTIRLSEDDHEALQRAADLLNGTSKYYSNYAQIYLTLGRAHCMLGNPRESVTYYEEYTRRRENNPLGHLELAFAYRAACSTAAQVDSRGAQLLVSPGRCTEQDYLNLSLNHFFKAGLSPDEFIRNAEQAFANQDYETAASWYGAGIENNLLQSPSLIFKYNLASVMSGKEMPFPEERSVEVYNISQNPVIEGRNLYWMREDPAWNVYFGDRLIDHPSSDPNVGVIWWRGAAIAVIEANVDSTYHVSVIVKDTDPGQIKLQIELDYSPVELFLLDGRSGEWKELTTQIDLKAGKHLFGVRMLEDTGDAIIDRVEFRLQN
jgi:hypothetical protein